MRGSLHTWSCCFLEHDLLGMFLTLAEPQFLCLSSGKDDDSDSTLLMGCLRRLNKLIQVKCLEHCLAHGRTHQVLNIIMTIIAFTSSTSAGRTRAAHKWLPATRASPALHAGGTYGLPTGSF